MVSASFSRLTRLLCVALCLSMLPGIAAAQLFGKRDSQDSEMAVRLSTLEDQVRQLNGVVEQQNHLIQQLQDQLRRMSEDYEYRFQQMGQGGNPNRPTASVQPQVQTQQPVPQVMAQPDNSGVQAGGTMGAATQPQTLGQVPGQPLDLSSALGGNQGGSTQPGFGQQTQQAPSLPPQQNPQLAAAPSGDPKDLYDLSYGYILRGEFSTAEASFKQFLAQFPQSEYAGNAQYWLGESLFARGMYRDAADAFLKGYSNYPKSAKAPESLYKLGMSLKELGQGEAACATFAEIPRRYPKAPQAVQERARNEAQKSGC
jgi:tol-pal system protein YbgF